MVATNAGILIVHRWPAPVCVGGLLYSLAYCRIFNPERFRGG